MDPDPAFQVNLDPDQKLKKKNTAHNILSYFNQKLQFTYVKLQEKLSALEREHPAVQKVKSGTRIRIRIANPDPEADPGTPLIPDPRNLYWMLNWNNYLKISDHGSGKHIRVVFTGKVQPVHLNEKITGNLLKLFNSKKMEEIWSTKTKTHIIAQVSTMFLPVQYRQLGMAPEKFNH